MAQTASFLPARSWPFDPPEWLRELRNSNSLVKVPMWDGKPAWLVTRHADACVLLQDRRLSSDTTSPFMPTMSEGQALALQRINLSRVDDPEHARLRRAVAAEFLPKALARLAPTIQGIVDRQIDQMVQRTPPVDFVRAYAMPVPSMVVSLLLGVPDDDLEFFQTRMLIMSDFYLSTPQQIMTADNELFAFVDSLVTHKESHPGDDLISRLVANQQDRLGHEEIVDTVYLLLTAGHSTTGNMTALSLLSVLTNPGFAQGVRENPHLTENAVEELLRYHSVVQRGVRRFALADITIGATTIRAGDGILVLLPSANRDADVFTAPDDLDVARDTRKHIAFGFGPHVCIGKSLARLELQISLQSLVHRIPTLQLAIPFDRLRFQEEMAHYGVRELPVTW